MRFRRQGHSERTIYIVYVLWMIGHSQRTIAISMGLRTKQVSGIVYNSPYNDRASMSSDAVRSALADLKAIRFGADKVPIDGGALNKIAFEPKPLTARQQRGPLRRKMQR